MTLTFVLRSSISIGVLLSHQACVYQVLLRSDISFLRYWPETKKLTPGQHSSYYKPSSTSSQLGQKLIEKINERKTRANAIQEEISITKQAASHLQIFIGMRDIEKRVEEENKSLVTLQNDEHFYQSDNHITYSEILSAIADRVPIFGEVLLESNPKNLSLILRKRLQSQIILPKMKGIEQIKLRPNCTNDKVTEHTWI